MNVADSTAIRAAALLLTIKRHLHILRHAKHHWQIPLRAEKARDATERQ
jgi:hypothetical protein